MNVLIYICTLCMVGINNRSVIKSTSQGQRGTQNTWNWRCSVRHFFLKKITLHTRRLCIVCAVNGSAVIAANMLVPMIYAEEANGCRYIAVYSDDYFWEFALRTRVTTSVGRVILRICSRMVAYTFSRLSFSKD